MSQNTLEGTTRIIFRGLDFTSYWQKKLYINVILLMKINPINVFFNSFGKNSNGDVKYHY